MLMTQIAVWAAAENVSFDFLNFSCGGLPLGFWPRLHGRTYGFFCVYAIWGLAAALEDLRVAVEEPNERGEVFPRASFGAGSVALPALLS